MIYTPFSYFVWGIVVEPISLLKVLSSETNLQILSLLRSGSFHPRELARLLHRSESDVSRRLKKLEKLGLVEGRWVRLGDRNVRVYSLKVDEVKIDFLPEKVQVDIGEKEDYTVPITAGEVPEVKFFVGRGEEIEILRSSKGKLVVVYGIAGIGKTSLLAKAFPEAFWYTLDGSESMEYLAWQLGLYLNSLGYTALLEYLRSGGKGEREIFELILDGLEETESVVIIDDLHKCQDDAVKRLLTYLAGKLRNGTVAVASRIKPMLGIEGVVYINLGGLKPREAYELAKNVRGEVSVEEFARIYRITRGHPLAIILLLESPELSEEVVRENFFEFLFMEIYQSLSADERRMLSILSLFEGPLEYDAIKTLYGKKNAFPVLHSLLRKGLVERRGRNYFVHDMLRGFLKEAESVNSKEYYLTYADYLLEKNNPHDFLKAFEYTLKAGAYYKIKDLVLLRLKKFKHVVGDFPKTYRRILIQVSDNPYAKAELGIIYFTTGFFQKARDILMEVEYEVEGIFRAEVVGILADVLISMEEFEKAEEYLEKLQRLAEELDDPDVWLWYYMEKTKYEYYQERPEKALESAFKELEISRRQANLPENEALVLLHIGDIYLEMEMPEKAVRYYKESLEVSRVYGMLSLEHLAYMELSKCHYILGNYEKAISYGTRAVEYFTRIRNYRRTVDTLAYRCVSWIALDDAERAEKDAREMIKIAHGTGYPLGWAGYIFLGTSKILRGQDGSEYLKKGREHLKEYPWLYDAVMEELGKVFDTSLLEETTTAPQAN
ncbi:Regulatory protein HTH/ArsR family, disease resistance-related, containing ATPase domain [Thermococcus gammatolerans EJ3]|uniref:Regulatory protein HTH/ArsR family, disease resistance-related, containing ATPase domain n=1 Tax=Thermococcus gammatolerans (strain DSM 15229 / JCM 11827 / EJ3) TaxID=593117 RepID=C5A1I1_THEGJ|nr:Regulatory protein HTH/ArsR family, disease resistance-related, containing ATPase domain [Thermococcus gammatolerans EJ3]